MSTRALNRQSFSRLPRHIGFNADFFVVDALWPDYEPEQFEAALRWYTMQDITLGG